MRLPWTMLKIAIALALAIPPLHHRAGRPTVGAFGALVGLAFLALRLAVIGLVIWGAFWLLRALLGGSRKKALPVVPELEPIGPYYEAARRELDRELGDAR